MNDIYQMARFCQTNGDIADYIAQNPNPGSVLSVATYDRIAEEYSNNTSNSYMLRLAVITNDHFLQIVNATYSSTGQPGQRRFLSFPFSILCCLQEITIFP